MNGPTHALITKKAIEFLTKEVSASYHINGMQLSKASEEIQQRNRDTDTLSDFEFVDVEGCINTGRDNPHKYEYDASNDVPHYTEKYEEIPFLVKIIGEQHLTSFNHFIDIKKGAGIFDDYDGYSYEHGSAKNDQYETQMSQYIDKITNYWFNDEYVHAPGHEYYKNCSPAAWRYSFIDSKSKFPDKYAELTARFPKAEHDGKKGKGIPYSVMMPVDNLGRYWYETFLLSGALGDLGPVLHAVQDATVPHHTAGYLGNYHRDYEDNLEKHAINLVDSPDFLNSVIELFKVWNSFRLPVPEALKYETDYFKIPNLNWSVDMLITWTAFNGYKAYNGVYQNFKKFSSLDKNETDKLLKIACAMSMLIFVKAKDEFEKSLPPIERKVTQISISHKTSNKDNADTDKDVNLYLYNNYCGGSVEMLFKDLPYNDREKGGTDKYTFNVKHLNIDAKEFKIGIGLLGQDNWLPTLFNISYMTADGKTYTYAKNLQWEKWFDNNFWHAIPKRPFIGGSLTVGKIVITHLTSTKIHADTQGTMSLLAKSGSEIVELDFPQEKWDKGETNTAVFDFMTYDLLASELELAIVNKSPDGWHPKTITVTVTDKNGNIIISENISWKNHTWFESSAVSKPVHWIIT